MMRAMAVVSIFFSLTSIGISAWSWYSMVKTERHIRRIYESRTGARQDVI